MNPPMASLPAWLLLPAVLSAEPLHLVKDGQPQAVIVIQGRIPARSKLRYEMTFPGKSPLPMQETHPGRKIGGAALLVRHDHSAVFQSP